MEGEVPALSQGPRGRPGSLSLVCSLTYQTEREPIMCSCGWVITRMHKMQLVLLAWDGGTGVWGGEPGSGPLSWSETGETDKAESILGRKENTGKDLEVVHGDGPLEMGLWSPHALPSLELSSLRKCEAAQGMATRFSFALPGVPAFPTWAAGGTWLIPLSPARFPFRTHVGTFSWS